MGHPAPTLLRELPGESGAVIKEVVLMEASYWQVTSTLRLPAQHGLLELFCQIQLDNGTLLQHSQVMDLHEPMTSDFCTLSPLVDETPFCVCRELAAEQAVGPTSATPTDAGGEPVPVVLYVVVAMIALFVILIISLSLVVVLLYRRKCGHMQVATPTGENSV